MSLANAMKVYRRRGMTPLISKFDTRWWRVVRLRLRFTPEKELRYASNRKLQSRSGRFVEQKIFSPAAIRITDRTASGLVSILSYPGFLEKVQSITNLTGIAVDGKR